MLTTMFPYKYMTVNALMGCVTYYIMFYIPY